MQIYNTFGIQSTADHYFEVQSEEDLLRLIKQGIPHPCFVLGGGSNVVFTRHFPGSIIHMANKGITIQSVPSSEKVLVTAAAGEEWDHFVRFCVAHGCYGAENLVAIPGNVGAAPVQNVGAYGVEAKNVIHSVRAIDMASGEVRIFSADECQFAYRNSIFKGECKDRYVIVSVTFELSTEFCPDLNYRAISDALTSAGIVNPTPQQLTDIITDIRWRKLPRPEEVGSAGSFFKNPIVSADHYQRLLESHPDMVAYPVVDGFKLAAGWLIEKAGWKGRDMGRCGVYEKQALVLVNRGGCTGQEVLALADAVTKDVNTLFGVTLEKEAIII